MDRTDTIEVYSSPRPQSMPTEDQTMDNTSVLYSNDTRQLSPLGAFGEMEVIQPLTYTQEIRTIVQILETKKKAAVRDEEFEDAKRFKGAIDRLVQASEYIDKLNTEKRAAIEDEDYDRADQYKKEMNAIRWRTYEEVDLLQMLTDKERQDLGLSNFPKPSRTVSDTRRAESAPGPVKDRPHSGLKSNPYLDRENMVLPAIRNHQKQFQIRSPENFGEDVQGSKLPPIESSSPLADEQYRQSQTAGIMRGHDSVHGDSDEEAIYRLHPKDVAQLTQAISTFGAKMVRHCTSKQWQERQKGLEDLRLYLDNNHFRDREDAFSVLSPSLQLLTRALKDKIFNVYKEATAVLLYLLTGFMPKYKISKAGGAVVADRTCSILISRTGDSVNDPRFRPTTMELVENVVKTTDSQIGKAYVVCLLRPFQTSGHQKIYQAHAELAERIIFTNAAPNPHLDLTEDTVCPFAVSCLQHTDPIIRQNGMRILTYMYKMGNREKVRNHLPRNNEATRKKYPSYKTILDELDCIDGKMGPFHVAALSNSRPGTFDMDELKKANEEIKRELTPQRSGTKSKTFSQPRRVRHSSHATAGRRYAEARNPQEDEANKSCVFCGEASSTFDEDMLDLHYLKFCPMLTKCQVCDKVVEICSLKQHLARDCAAKYSIKQCPRCQELFPEESYRQHQVLQRCQVEAPSSSTERCMLCKKDVKPNDENGWKRHLMGGAGCEGNPRKMFRAGQAKRYASRRRNSTGTIDQRRKM